jgi:type IV pilus assembly protein PilO
MSKAGTNAWSHRTQFRVLLLSCGAAVGVYLWCLYLPNQNRIQAIWNEIDQKEAEIIAANSLASEIQQTQLKLDATQKFIDHWRKQAPQAESVAPVFGDIVKLARDSQTELVSFTPKTELPLENVSLVPVVVQARGSYHSLHEFLRELESLPLTIWIEDLEIQKRDSTSDLLECGFLMTIFTERSDISG